MFELYYSKTDRHLDIIDGVANNAITGHIKYCQICKREILSPEFYIISKYGKCISCLTIDDLSK